jgi:hypothetical protein
MHETGQEVTASLRFGGYANDRIIQQKIDELKQILDNKGISYSGEFVYLGYYPPCQTVNRRRAYRILPAFQPEDLLRWQHMFILARFSTMLGFGKGLTLLHPIPNKLKL